MAPTKSKTWRSVKAQIILRYGSVTECARDLRCSTEALRLTLRGKCPRVKRRLEEALQ